MINSNFYIQTSGTTTTGADWVFNGKFPVKGREIYWDFDYPSMAGTFACKVFSFLSNIDFRAKTGKISKNRFFTGTGSDDQKRVSGPFINDITPN